MRGVHHGAHAYPPKKEMQIVSEKQENQSLRRTNYMALGVAFGLILGAAMGLALDNMAFVGAGLPIGVALGVALQRRHEQDDV